MLGDSLAGCIGASAMLYAAIAYFVFDEAFYIEDLLENHPEEEDEIRWWLDDIQSTFFDVFTNLRRYYETDYDGVSRTPQATRTQRPYVLLVVKYSEHDEDVVIAASRDPRDHHLGNQWRLLTEPV